MAEPQEQASSSTSPSSPSPLGTDEGSSDVFADIFKKEREKEKEKEGESAVDEPKKEEAEAQPDPEDKAQSTGPSVSEDELLKLREDAELYRAIKADPELSGKVLELIHNKTRQIPAKPQGDEPAYVRELRDQNAKSQQAMRELIAYMQVKEFFTENPDAKAHKQEIGRLMDKYSGMTLNEAFDIAKRAKASQGQQAAPSAPKVKQAEGRNNGGVSPKTGSEKALARINDPKALPRTDDYIAEAFKEAVRLQNDEGGL